MTGVYTWEIADIKPLVTKIRGLKLHLRPKNSQSPPHPPPPHPPTNFSAIFDLFSAIFDVFFG